MHGRRRPPLGQDGDQRFAPDVLEELLGVLLEVLLDVEDPPAGGLVDGELLVPAPVVSAPLDVEVSGGVVLLPVVSVPLDEPLTDPLMDPLVDESVP